MMIFRTSRLLGYGIVPWRVPNFHQADVDLSGFMASPGDGCWWNLWILSVKLVFFLGASRDLNHDQGGLNHNQGGLNHD